MSLRRRATRLMVCLLLCSAGLLSGCKRKVGDGSAHDPKATAEAPPSASKGGGGIRLPSIIAKPAFAQAHRQGVTKTSEVTLADIAERSVRSVVNIRSTKTVQPQGYNPFFGPAPARRARSLGSGVIVSADGVVLTNHHVVKQATEIRVTLSDEREYRAKLVGSDPKSDIAVLRLQDAPKTFQPLPFGDSSKMRLGEVVLAIGNPFGVGQTVTMGIVSAVGRAKVGIVDYEDFIQTDAAINPGNSGGALVNMRGQLIGINTAILSKSGGYQGIGFAVPTKMAKPIMQSLLERGRVVRGWLGVSIQDLSKELATAMKLSVERGVLVADVQAGSPAAKAGLQRGDVIVALAGQAIKSVVRLRNAIALNKPGTKVKVKLLRANVSREVEVTLGELPGERVARLGGQQGALGGLTLETLDRNNRSRFGLPRDIEGVVVTSVKPSSAAQRAGLRPGDVILEINRRPLRNTLDFQNAYRAAPRRLLLLVFRGGSPMYLLLDK